MIQKRGKLAGLAGQAAELAESYRPINLLLIEIIQKTSTDKDFRKNGKK